MRPNKHFVNSLGAFGRTSFFLHLCSALIFAGGIFQHRDWDGDKAEIAKYRATTTYLGKEFAYEVALVVEKRFRAPISGMYGRTPLEKVDPIIQSSIHYHWTRLQGQRSVSVSVQHSFQGQNTWLSQQTMVSDWNLSAYRTLENGEKKATLEERSNWRTRPKTWDLKKQPLFTREQLLTSLRQYNLKEPINEAIYLLSPTTEDVIDPKVLFAEIKSSGEAIRLDENDVVPVTIEIENGEKIKLYYLSSDMHTLFKAEFPDKTKWELASVEWGRYWFLTPQ